MIGPAHLHRANRTIGAPRPRITTAALAALAMLLVSLLISGSPAAASDARPAAVPKLAQAAEAVACPTQEPPSGLVKQAHPVILVHGWNGSPLRQLRSSLEQKQNLPTGWQFKVFDYSKVASYWAARPEIATCLARYILQVSDAHRAAHGDGKVYVVAHSMGGLATAFAADPAFNGNADVASRLGGLVTMDTPWLGSVWGDGILAEAGHILSTLAPWDWGRMGDTRSDAWKCLRARDPGASFACSTPGYLPTSAPVTELAGEITLSRSFLGVHAYDLNMQSDAVVGTSSQHGYLGMATGSTKGQQVSLPKYSCTQHVEAILGKDPKALAAGALLFFNDSAAMDSVLAGTASAPLALFVAQVVVTAPCSHINITKDSGAAQMVADALRGQAASRIIKLSDALNGPAPADCQHPAGRFRNGEQTGNLGNPGFSNLTWNGKWHVPPARVDLTGDGNQELVAVMQCSAGGVGWPDRLLVYQQGRKGVTLLGHIGLGGVTPAEHSTVSALSPGNGAVTVTWTSYEGCCSDQRGWSATVKVAGGKVTLQGLKQTSGARAPGRAIQVSQGTGDGFVTPSGNIACVLFTGEDNDGVDCELLTGKLTSPPAPPKPPDCPVDWGNRLSIHGGHASFSCYGDTVRYYAALGADSTRWWFDAAQDLTVNTPWSPAAAPHEHSVVENGTTSCAVERDSVSCSNTHGSSTSGFSLSSSGWSMRR